MPHVPLVEVVRSGFVESVHHGSVVVLDADGSALLELGDTTSPIFPRSSNKLAQAAAMVGCGLDLSGELLALSAASHSGEPFHLRAVQRVLELAGLPESVLRNTPDLPFDRVERRAWVRAGREPSSVAQNCSGKHAGMVTTCVRAGWDVGTYLHVDHPLQQAMASTLGELAGEPVAATGVDGCGAPVMAVSLTGLARSFAALAVADAGSPGGRVAQAVRAHPEFVAGTRRDATRLMRQVPGAIAKDGAEAVYAAALPDGRAVALKIADGGDRARPVVMGAALRVLGLPQQQIGFLEESPVLGHGAPVGAVRAIGF
ncbi:asparaginase [Angustibacter aerolatus]